MRRKGMHRGGEREKVVILSHSRKDSVVTYISNEISFCENSFEYFPNEIEAALTRSISKLAGYVRKSSALIERYTFLFGNKCFHRFLQRDIAFSITSHKVNAFSCVTQYTKKAFSIRRDRLKNAFYEKSFMRTIRTFSACDTCRTCR